MLFGGEAEERQPARLPGQAAFELDKYTCHGVGQYSMAV